VATRTPSTANTRFLVPRPARPVRSRGGPLPQVQRGARRAGALRDGPARPRLLPHRGSRHRALPPLQVAAQDVHARGAHLPRREDRGRGRGQAGDVRGRLRVRPQLRRGRCPKWRWPRSWTS
ncbi:Protein of unknown function, partial [Gryllus bimaculatus]